MAVEAPHMSLFSSHSPLNDNRDFLKPNQSTNVTMFPASQIGSGASFLAAGGFNDGLGMPQQTAGLPFYQSLVNCDLASIKPNFTANNNKSDSGVTYTMNPPPATRKRARDPAADQFIDAYGGGAGSFYQKTKFSGMSSLIDDELVSQINQQQSEIDRFVAEHNQRVRMELEERRRRQSRMLVSAIQEGIVKRLKEKDEEIQRMGKLNWVLQERVKSLYVENQIWRDLAQTNEAAANTLRSNLEQVLAHVGEDRECAAAAVADDAESICGSSDHHHRRCSSAAAAAEEDEQRRKMKCRKCGEKESSVLVLPCRHLCLCTVCGSTLVGTCPVCDSIMNGSVHVNIC
ncbi:E3 ubiquitin-protein ligase BOI [Linum perenne]